METRIEYKENFCIYGYSSPTLNIETHDSEIAILRQKYEATLESILDDENSLNFVICHIDEHNWVYHLGVTKWDDFSDKNATCVEVPSGYFAVGTASDDVPALKAWGQLFGSSVGNALVAEMVEQENRKYFERYDKNGNYEIWAPIVDINKAKA